MRLAVEEERWVGLGGEICKRNCRIEPACRAQLLFAESFATTTHAACGGANLHFIVYQKKLHKFFDAIYGTQPRPKSASMAVLLKCH